MDFSDILSKILVPILGFLFVAATFFHKWYSDTKENRERALNEAMKSGKKLAEIAIDRVPVWWTNAVRFSLIYVFPCLAVLFFFSLLYAHSHQSEKEFAHLKPPSISDLVGVTGFMAIALFVSVVVRTRMKFARQERMNDAVVGILLLVAHDPSFPADAQERLKQMVGGALGRVYDTTYGFSGRDAEEVD